MRKNILVLALLFCVRFSLAAQFGPDASIFVTAVTGKGGRSQDNAFFYKQLVMEIAGQNFNLAKTQRSADFSLIGTLGPYRGYINAPPYEGQFAFHLELRNNKTGAMMVEGELLYEAQDDAKDQLPALVSTLLYTIPVDNTPGEPAQPPTVPGEPDNNDDWRNKWLYLGLAATWNPRFYIGNDIGNNIGDDGAWYLPRNPHIGFSAELHFLDFLSFETGVELSADNFDFFYSSRRYNFMNTNIEFPFLLKFVFKPNSSFMFEPYAGAQINIPRYDKPLTTLPSKLSLLFGFQYAIKAGPGAVFIDARLAIDAANSKVNPPADIPKENMPEYRRYFVHLGLGYKYGFSQRNLK